MGQRPSMQTWKRGHAWSHDPAGVVSWEMAGRSAAGCGGIGGFWRRRRTGDRCAMRSTFEVRTAL
jgi:hypothetical protein